MSEVAERVKAIIVDKLSVEETEVTNEASFTNDLGADSLDTVELIINRTKIAFCTKDIHRLSSLYPVIVLYCFNSKKICAKRHIFRKKYLFVVNSIVKDYKSRLSCLYGKLCS